MNIIGKVIEILPVAKGNTTKGSWKKQSFILETEGTYPKKVCIDLWGDKIESVNLSHGMVVDASVEVASRAYNGRWFTDVKAWRIVQVPDIVETQSLGDPQKMVEQISGNREIDDLPF